MKIVATELKPCVQRQADPDWKFARGTVPALHGWTLALTDEAGTVGLGYVHAIPTITTHGEGAKAAADYLTPRLIGCDPAAVNEIMDDVDAALAGNTSVKAAIDMALHDLLARRLGVPLHVLFGGKRRDTIPQGRIVPIKSPADMAAIARGLVGGGYKMVKVKLSGEIELDIERVAAVRQAIEAKTILTVDPNQTYSAKSFIRSFSRFEKHDVALVEQPVPAADWKGLALLTRTLPVSVEADESAGSLADVARLVNDGVADVINIKVTKLGGLRNTLAAVKICEAGGVVCRMGAAFGPALLQACSAHVAVTFRKLELPCELSEHLHLHDDPFTPAAVDNGVMRVPQGNGCGVTLA